MEWDPNFNFKFDKLIQYKKFYLNKLNSESSEEIFLSSVMLGLFKEKESIPKLKTITREDTNAKIGIAFALCMLNQDCQSNTEYLMKTGEITQIAGNAVSLKYLEAVELLSLLEVDNFINYASNLKKKTEEVYQKEAIEITIERYKRLRINTVKCK